MPQAVAERKMAIPSGKEWVEVKVEGFSTRLTDGARISVPSYSIQVAKRYPCDEDGKLLAGMEQREVAAFLREYNEAHGTAFRYPALYEDETMRDRLGKEHEIFDENFERNGQLWRWGYVADFTRPNKSLEPVEGIGGQQLVQRVAYWRLPEGDVELGPVTIAPSGMVPTLARKQMEKMICKEGLKILAKLRGSDIYEKGDDIVDVRNSLGYPQYTLDHEAGNEGGLIPHSHHVWTPSQDSGEAVGVRYADWRHLGGRRCFYVRLDVVAEYSHSSRSFPLVRGGNVEAKIVKSACKISL